MARISLDEVAASADRKRRHRGLDLPLFERVISVDYFQRGNGAHYEKLTITTWSNGQTTEEVVYTVADMLRPRAVQKVRGRTRTKVTIVGLPIEGVSEHSDFLQACQNSLATMRGELVLVPFVAPTPKLITLKGSGR
mgnify:CR=1 FL=1